MATRRFEYRDGKSEKFWCIELDGDSHTVVYGRIGTSGQSKTKEFPSDEKAKAACEKLIAQKTGKGYREVGKSVKKKPAVKKKIKATKKTKSLKKATAKKSSEKKTAKNSKPFLIEVKAELPLIDYLDNRVKDPAGLKLLDGFMHTEDSLLDYADELQLELTGGYLRCEFDKNAKKLFIITDYNSVVELSQKELKRIEDDTSGQWSDGIGEGCFGDFCETSGYGVDTFSKISVSQTKGLAQTPSTHKADQKKLLERWKKAMKKNQPTGSKKEFQSLILAIEENKIRKVESLIGKVNLNQWQKSSWADGETPLTCAAGKGHSNLVRLLLDHGADPNFPREDGDAPIHCCENKDCVKLILDAGVSASAKSKLDDSGLPLHRECVLSDKGAIKLLIKCGADPNAKNKFKKTALEIAAGDCGPDSIKALLDGGAKVTEEALVSAATAVEDWDEADGEKDIIKKIKLLLKAGAKVTKTVIFQAMPFTTDARLKVLLSTGFNVNHAPWAFYSNDDKKRLLELAAEEGTDSGLVAVLLKHGADPNLCPQALDVAIDQEDEKMVRMLLKAGAKTSKKQVEAAKEKLPKLETLLAKSLK